MVIMTPALAAIALQILPSIAPFVGELTGKKKEGEILGTILALPGMAAGVLGKSPSIAQTPTPTEHGASGLQIGGLTGKIADQTQQNFSGWSMDKGFLGDTFENNQASIYKGLFG